MSAIKLRLQKKKKQANDTPYLGMEAPDLTRLVCQMHSSRDSRSGNRRGRVKAMAAVYRALCTNTSDELHELQSAPRRPFRLWRTVYDVYDIIPALSREITSLNDYQASFVRRTVIANRAMTLARANHGRTQDTPGKQITKKQSNQCRGATWAKLLGMRGAVKTRFIRSFVVFHR